MTRLAAFLREHGEAVEYDLRAYWSCALTDITWRQLRVFLEHVPLDSATARSVHGEAAVWGMPEQLLAAVVDVLNWANYQRGGGKGNRPRPVKRPGDGRRTTHYGRTHLSSEQAIDLLARARDGTIADP
ncbi:hypothetical protein SMC26_40290 [Actinomadura fulvescens]|uniref:Transposase n=1 Tax=Actinomadura fulvescens TaxID=46160 RepID=A0ABN3Q6R6_9ACTN